MMTTLRCPESSRQLDFPPSMNCQACGTALAATAKFCHKCGAQVSAQTTDGQAAGWRAGLPWGVAGAALGALVTVLALRIGAPSGGGGRGGGGGVGGAARGPLVTVLALRIGAPWGGGMRDAGSVSEDDASRIPLPASRSSPPS